MLLLDGGIFCIPKMALMVNQRSALKMELFITLLSLPLFISLLLYAVSSIKNSRHSGVTTVNENLWKKPETYATPTERLSFFLLYSPHYSFCWYTSFTHFLLRPLCSAWLFNVLTCFSKVGLWWLNMSAKKKQSSIVHQGWSSSWV